MFFSKFSFETFQALTSPLVSKVSLNVGREAGTTMPADWAASGARLALPLEVTKDTSE